ncbi:MAG: hypothetical protein AMJ95_11415 [Omnitrophica WOR_2 bacterium SM23_72]|nr:MAG: hypothetical protein AMJ95_11415 [Omnitrophica WOR_2 bacterium SM23_72]
MSFKPGSPTYLGIIANANDSDRLLLNEFVKESVLRGLFWNQTRKKSILIDIREESPKVYMGRKIRLNTAMSQQVKPILNIATKDKQIKREIKDCTRRFRTIIAVSDIHLGNECFTKEDDLIQLIELVRDYYATFLINGDLLSSEGKNYEQIKIIFRNLLEVLRDVQHIVYVAGNHDRNVLEDESLFKAIQEDLKKAAIVPYYFDEFRGLCSVHGHSADRYHNRKARASRILDSLDKLCKRFGYENTRIHIYEVLKRLLPKRFADCERDYAEYILTMAEMLSWYAQERGLEVEKWTIILGHRHMPEDIGEGAINKFLKCLLGDRFRYVNTGTWCSEPVFTHFLNPEIDMKKSEYCIIIKHEEVMLRNGVENLRKEMISSSPVGENIFRSSSLGKIRTILVSIFWEIIWMIDDYMLWPLRPPRMNDMGIKHFNNLPRPSELTINPSKRKKIKILKVCSYNDYFPPDTTPLIGEKNGNEIIFVQKKWECIDLLVKDLYEFNKLIRPKIARRILRYLEISIPTYEYAREYWNYLRAKESLKEKPDILYKYFLSPGMDAKTMEVLAKIIELFVEDLYSFEDKSDTETVSKFGAVVNTMMTQEQLPEHRPAILLPTVRIFIATGRPLIQKVPMKITAKNKIDIAPHQNVHFSRAPPTP